MTDSQMKMEELNEIRDKINEAQEEKSMLEGELKGYEKRIIVFCRGNEFSPRSFQLFDCSSRLTHAPKL